MNDKLTIEQLQYIQTIERTDDVASRHVRIMATEILEFRGGLQWLKLATKPTESNPHAELIAQCEQDKIDYPDFWSELYQWKNSNDEWCAFSENWIQAQFKSNFEYRQHTHRDSIIEYHQCSDDEKLRLKLGLIHLTEEDAKKYLAVFQAVNAQVES